MGYTEFGGWRTMIQEFTGSFVYYKVRPYVENEDLSEVRVPVGVTPQEDMGYIGKPIYSTYLSGFDKETGEYSVETRDIENDSYVYFTKETYKNNLNHVSGSMEYKK